MILDDASITELVSTSYDRDSYMSMISLIKIISYDIVTALKNLKSAIDNKIIADLIETNGILPSVDYDEIEKLIDMYSYVASPEWSDSIVSIVDELGKYCDSNHIDGIEIMHASEMYQCLYVNLPLDVTTFMLKKGKYRLFIDVNNMSPDEYEMGYYINTDELIDDIDNKLPHVIDASDIKNTIQIWVEEFNRIVDMGLPLFSEDSGEE